MTVGRNMQQGDDNLETRQSGFEAFRLQFRPYYFSEQIARLMVLMVWVLVELVLMGPLGVVGTERKRG
ncbi:hypothetical protein BDW42DRAFT_176717 [Aspergillus taichungensis]|uniref:Uncharacterized protein n=1 Tax=Aspergillus taichungensis TaxID=482145 RepID=A0A2J5HK72_9EURO|nr:hypothetical protein BDW42DRAFT_176717 [Aspergillus taichungensis]